MTNYFKNLVSATKGEYSEDLPITAYDILKEAHEKIIVSDMYFNEYLNDDDENKCAEALTLSREVSAMLHAYRILTEREIVSTRIAIEAEMEWLLVTFNLTDALIA